MAPKEEPKMGPKKPGAVGAKPGTAAPRKFMPKKAAATKKKIAPAPLVESEPKASQSVATTTAEDSALVRELQAAAREEGARQGQSFSSAFKSSGATMFGGDAGDPRLAARRAREAGNHGGYWSGGQRGGGGGGGGTSTRGSAEPGEGVVKREDGGVELAEEDAKRLVIGGDEAGGEQRLLTFADGLANGVGQVPVTLPVPSPGEDTEEPTASGPGTSANPVAAARRPSNPLRWLVDEDANDYRKVLLHFPPVLPFLTEREGGTGEGARSADEPILVPGRLRNLDSGLLGKLLVFESGAVKLRLAGTDVLLDVTPGVPVIYRSEVAVIGDGHASFLSPIQQRLSVTPDLVTLLEPGATRDWPRAVPLARRGLFSSPSGEGVGSASTSPNLPQIQLKAEPGTEDSSGNPVGEGVATAMEEDDDADDALSSPVVGRARRVVGDD